MSERLLLGITQSVCPTCRSLVPAKVLGINGDVYFEKYCPEHGHDLVFIRADVQDYIHTLRYVKPASQPLAAFGNNDLPCPAGCGFCDRHEQHLCLPIIEITNECDMACPICLVNAGGKTRISVGEFSYILDRLTEAEPQIDILNISGGEPLTHPDLLAIIDNALARPEIVRVSISTNGLRLIRDTALLSELKARDVVISLQFDGVEDRIYQALRGRPLVREKQLILEKLISHDITTSLTMTAARDINENAFAPVLKLLFSTPNIVSLMVQPLVYDGRARNIPIPEKRLTLPEILTLLESSGYVEADDFTPLPCCHPACFSLSFYLMTDDGRHTSLGKLFDASAWLDIIANKAVFGLDEEEHEKIKHMIYELWSGPGAGNPESEAVLVTVRKLLRDISAKSCGCFDSRTAFTVGEKKIKSVFVHAFQDADTFDLARVRRCCNGYPQKDGRVIPSCVMNVLKRH